MAAKPPAKTAGITDEAVQRRTGKTWSEWRRTLDRAGAAGMSHREIAAFLAHKYNLGGWWSQMVTVGYEHASGRRQKHERPGGFEISRSRTLHVPVSAAYAAWKEARIRKSWLREGPLRVRTATANRSLRLTWSDGQQILSVHFYSAGRARCRVVVQHTKLPNAGAAEKMKAYWGDALERLTAHVES